MTVVCAAECAHLFVESRSIDLGAIVAGTIGVAVGVLTVRRLSAHAPVAPAPVAFAPAVACVAWAAVIVWLQWYPFNFILDSGEALARIQRLTSWSSFAGSGQSAGAVASTFVMTLPLGVWLRRALGPASPVGMAVIVCSFIAVAALWCGVEFGLALLPDRAAGLAQVPVAMCGAVAGLWLGGLFLTPGVRVLS
jgi:hypothetical protein